MLHVICQVFQRLGHTLILVLTCVAEIYLVTSVQRRKLEYVFVSWFMGFVPCLRGKKLIVVVQHIIC